MMRRRWILLALAVPAVAAIVASCIWYPLEYQWELLCYVYVVPVVIVNVWEWIDPEVNERLFGKGRETWGLWD